MSALRRVLQWTLQWSSLLAPALHRSAQQLAASLVRLRLTTVASSPQPVVEDRTAELEAAVEHYKDVLFPDYRDPKAAYEK